MASASASTRRFHASVAASSCAPSCVASPALNPATCGSMVTVGKLAGSISAIVPTSAATGTVGVGRSGRPPGHGDRDGQHGDREHTRPPLVARARRPPADAGRRTASGRGNGRDRPPLIRRPGKYRSNRGRAAHTITNPESRPTLAPNSVSQGAMSTADTTPIAVPNTMRATRPAGTVRGSVIMKNRKIRISGDVMMIHQKWVPVIGVNDQRVVIEWSARASTASPAASEIQSAAPSPSRRRRLQMNRPPATMTAYAATIGQSNGAHQKSSGSTRPLPSTRNAATRAMLDGLKTWPLRNRITYLREQSEGADGGEQVPPAQRPVVAVLRSDHPEQQGGARARLERTRRPHEQRRPPVRRRQLDRGARRQRDDDLGDGDPEAEPPDADEQDREDHHRQVDAWVADARRHVPVRARPDPDGAGERGVARRPRTRSRE